MTDTPYPTIGEPIMALASPVNLPIRGRLAPAAAPAPSALSAMMATAIIIPTSPRRNHSHSPQTPRALIRSQVTRLQTSPLRRAPRPPTNQQLTLTTRCPSQQKLLAARIKLINDLKEMTQARIARERLSMQQNMRLQTLTRNLDKILCDEEERLTKL